MSSLARAMFCLALLGGCERTAPVPSPAPSASAVSPRAGAVLAVKRRSVDGRQYLDLSGATLALRLQRPHGTDPRVLCVVPGTYTSPDNQVEGAVVLDGKIVRDQALGWEALLIIEAGKPEIRWQKQTPERAVLAAIAGRRASALQGHLLVAEGVTRPLLPSTPLRRRAIVTRSPSDFSIVESEQPIELAHFARDLVRLGAKHAMNLDMGRWSEGWYRRSNGTMAQLGDDFRATARQTNWLVLLAR